MSKEKTKQKENPYKKIFDDAHQCLASQGIDISFLEGVKSIDGKKGFIAPFPYGTPVRKRQSGWN